MAVSTAFIVLNRPYAAHPGPVWLLPLLPPSARHEAGGRRRVHAPWSRAGPWRESGRGGVRSARSRGVSRTPPRSPSLTQNQHRSGLVSSSERSPQAPWRGAVELALVRTLARGWRLALRLGRREGDRMELGVAAQRHADSGRVQDYSGMIASARQHQQRIFPA